MLYFLKLADSEFNDVFVLFLKELVFHPFIIWFHLILVLGLNIHCHSWKEQVWFPSYPRDIWKRMINKFLHVKLDIAIPILLFPLSWSPLAHLSNPFGLSSDLSLILILFFHRRVTWWTLLLNLTWVTLLEYTDVYSEIVLHLLQTLTAKKLIILDLVLFLDIYPCNLHNSEDKDFFFKILSLSLLQSSVDDVSQRFLMEIVCFLAWN